MPFYNTTLGLEAEKQDRSSRPVISLPSDSFFISEVIDSFAHLGFMRVNAAASGPINAVAIAESSGFSGPRKVGSIYPPHTQVLCFQPPGIPYCYIIGAVPQWILDPHYNLVPDWLVSASQSGIGNDRVHNHGPVSRDNGITGDINFSAGSPCDELPGDYGYLNELGVGFGLGKLVSWLRASHFCGVEAHWIDNLLRLIGHNFERLLSASETRAFDDEGEFTRYDRWGPYPWETLGVYNSATDFTKSASGKWGSGTAGREPVYDDQMGIWRVQEFRGFLGDISRLFVGLPRSRSYEEGPERLSQDTVMPGVLDKGYSLDGAYHVRSAKGILLEKSVAIPVPKEKTTPDDAKGDNSENYKAAGVYGEGKDHNKPIVEIEDDRAGIRALMAFERHSLLYNYFSNLGFVRHEKDWYLPNEEESAVELGVASGVYAGSKAVNTVDFWMPLPSKVDVDVDHRGSTRYYSGRARIQIDEDGSVLIEDAYGSQVQMAGGNLFLDARNDIVMRAGRNIQFWAGHDLIEKAGNSIDITSSQKDVRIKAQGNLMLGAIDKGILLEAQDDGGTPDWEQLGEEIESRGIVLKALNSSFITMSRDTYIRSGSLTDTRAAGELHIDAGEGLGNLFLHGGRITQRANYKSEIIVGSTTGENASTASFDFQPNQLIVGGAALSNVYIGATNFAFGQESTNARVTILGDALIRGNVVATGLGVFDDGLRSGSDVVSNGSMLLDGSLSMTGNILAKGIAVDNGGSYLPSTGDDFNASDQAIPEHPDLAERYTSTEQERLRNALQAERLADNALVIDLKEELYGDNSRFASSSLITNAVFSFRTPDQYGTDNEFIWFESRWQQYNRFIFDVNTLWSEPSLLAPHSNRKTAPYPGYEVWEEEAAFAQLDSELFNFDTGTSINRTDLENKELTKPSLKRFKDAYNVTLQHGLVSNSGDTA